MFRVIIAAVVIAGSGYLLLNPSEPSCDAKTPKTFVVSANPYVCDFTRGAGPLVR